MVLVLVFLQRKMLFDFCSDVICMVLVLVFLQRKMLFDFCSDVICMLKVGTYFTFSSTKVDV